MDRFSFELCTDHFPGVLFFACVDEGILQWLLSFFVLFGIAFCRGFFPMYLGSRRHFVRISALGGTGRVARRIWSSLCFFCYSCWYAFALKCVWRFVLLFFFFCMNSEREWKQNLVLLGTVRSIDTLMSLVP
jgi:hypothetical protein